MAQDAPQDSSPGRPYFAYTGWTIAVILAVDFLGILQNRPWNTVLIRQVIAVLVMMGLFTALAVALRLGAVERFSKTLETGVPLKSPQPRFLNWLTVSDSLSGTTDRARVAVAMARLRCGFAQAASSIYLILALTLLFESHRRFLIVIAVFNALAINALRRPPTLRFFGAVLLLSLTTWGLTSGLTYTNLGDWMFNSASSALAIAAFVLSTGLVLTELCDDRLDFSKSSTPRILLVGLILLFAMFAFRSDHLLDSWVPYHRSFVADTAQLVRDGYWLLWDVPSVYGFLSVLAVAAVPAKDAWQGLFILTSVIVLVESCIIFTLWRWGRTDWKNLTFAVLIALGTFGENISRYPWSARLYPQGGLRFLWVLSLLFIAFLAYAWREDVRRVRALHWVGHCVWVMSLFWSFEAAVWSTVVWLPYVILLAFTSDAPSGLPRRLARNLWPIAALPIAAMTVVELVYRLSLGHGPDLFSYVEFTGLFVSGTVRAAFPINPAGAGWCIVIVLGSVGSVVIAAIREAQWPVLPLLTATWLAVWATSTYYAVEPFDGHVALLLCIMIPAAAIVTFVSRSALRANLTAFFARLSAAPIAIVCIAFFLGEPSRLATAAFPFTPGWTSDTLQVLPPISGELARLLTKARIQPGDRVLIPNRQYWTEISQGMLFPITHTRAGDTVAYRPWVPLSPLGIQGSIMGVPGARRQTYIERHLARFPVGGWYVEYRAPAICEAISPRLVTRRTLSSTNYSASLCDVFARKPIPNVQRARS